MEFGLRHINLFYAVEAYICYRFPKLEKNKDFGRRRRLKKLLKNRSAPPPPYYSVFEDTIMKDSPFDASYAIEDGSCARRAIKIEDDGSIPKYPIRGILLVGDIGLLRQTTARD